MWPIRYHRPGQVFVLLGITCPAPGSGCSVICQPHVCRRIHAWCACAYQAVEALTAGYQKNPPPGVDLNSLKSHLACQAFLARDFDRSLSLAEELGPRRNVSVFGLYRFSPLEILHAKSRQAAHLPFDLGMGDAIWWLAFAREGKSLIALCSHRRSHEFAVQDGSIVCSSAPERQFRNFAVPWIGDRFTGDEESGAGLGILTQFATEKPLAGVQLVSIMGDAETQKYWAAAESARRKTFVVEVL